MQNTAIQIQDLQKSFDGKAVLKGVTLDIPQGKTTVILGPSGTGKSVLLKHILGLLEPDSGAVLINGKNIHHLERQERQELLLRFGVVFQSGALFDSMTVLENVLFPLEEKALRSNNEDPSQKKSNREAIAQKQLALFGLEGAEYKYPSEISGGMRKRVALSRATVLNPEFVLYDEPTTGLDPISQRNVDDLIREAEQKLGVTSLVISHDLHSAMYVAYQIAVLFEGKIVFCGSSEELLKCAHPFVVDYLRLSR